MARGSDAFAFVLNVSTSVLIVFVNKLLMDSKHGYGFTFATTLCALHFYVSGLAVKVSEWLGYETPVRLALKDVLGYSIIAATSVATLNLSLMLNSVGFYQISKLLIIPFVCVVESIWYNKRYTLAVLSSVALVVVGVAIVSVTDVSINLAGFAVAMVSVVTSGLQQIMCGSIQRTHKLTSTQLLSIVAPLQGLLLTVVGPAIDQLVSERWVFHYRFTPASAACLAASCAVAILVNISQFMCLGRFSALTFQVLGHAKTVLVLLLGVMYLYDAFSTRKLMGMSLAMAGMILYGWLNSRPQPASNKSGDTVHVKIHDASSPEKQPLLSPQSTPEPSPIKSV